MSSVFSIVVTSALVATVVGALIEVWRESWKNKRSTKLEALNIAVILEGYVIRCADRIAAHETAVSSEGYAGSYMGSVPNYPELKISAGFLRPRKAALANNLLVFPQTVEQADQEAAFWWDVVGDLDAARNAAKICSARVGLSSITLAKEIREAFDLPGRKLIFGKYDIQGVLEENANDQ